MYVVRNTKTILYFTLISLFVLASSSVLAQTEPEQTEQKDRSMRGFDFYFNCGVYLPNKYSAIYYNGNPYFSEGNVNVLRVLNNKQLKDEIDDLIRRNNNVILDDDGVWVSEFDTDMKYSPAFIFGFGVLYHFNANFSITLSFSQARTTAAGGMTFTYNTGILGNERPEILRYSVMGKEIRNFFEIGVNYMFRPHKILFPFIECAAQLNSLDVKQADLIIEGHSFTMLDYYGGMNFDPSNPNQYPELDPQLGGIGGGVLLGVGLRIAFNDWVALEPVVQMQYSFINLKGLKAMKPHGNIMIRLIVGDKLFAKRS